MEQKAMALTHVALQKTTLLDFPGEVAATVFTPGCNLRCPYCHNPKLVQPPYPEDLISLEELDYFLEKRAKVLGGVCISGGEPLLHKDLSKLIGLIRSHGLKVKLDTNGTFPERLAQIDADYIAMDLKTSPEKYEELFLPGSKKNYNKENLGTQVKKSLNYLKNSGIPYEIRTTVVPGIIGREEMNTMAPLLEGVEKYSLTPFRGGNTLDPEYSHYPPPSEALMDELCKLACIDCPEA